MGQAGAPAEDIPSERVMEELRNIMFPEDGTVVSALEHTGGSIQVPASVMLAPSSAAAGAQAEGGDPLQRCDSGIELMQHFELLLPDADVDTLPQAAVGAPAVECGSSNILGHHVQGDYANGTRKQIRADQLRSLVGDKGIGIVTHHRQPHDIRVLHISAEYLKELKAVHSAVHSGQSAVSSEQSTAPFSTADHTMLEMLSEFFAAAEAKGMGKGHTITNSVLWQCIHCNPTASSQGAWFPCSGATTPLTAADAAPSVITAAVATPLPPLPLLHHCHRCCCCTICGHRCCCCTICGHRCCCCIVCGHRCCYSCCCSVHLHTTLYEDSACKVDIGAGLSGPTLQSLQA